MKIPAKLLKLITGFCLSLNLSGQMNDSHLKIFHLTGNFYVYTTYNVFNGTPFPSNSMYLVTDEGVVMFDTPWDTTQFQPLLDSIQNRHQQKVIMCIATHFHQDRTGGFGFLKARGIKTFSSKQTFNLCKQYNMNQAGFYFEKDTTFNVGNYSFQTYFGGEGHTKDNIVIWFKKERILYGGCLVKSIEAINLGNTKDANLEEWKATIINLKNKFARPAYIITGHQNWRSIKSLDHTLELLQIHKSKS